LAASAPVIEGNAQACFTRLRRPCSGDLHPWKGQRLRSEIVAGLSVASDGTLSGVPTAAGASTVTVRDINVAGHTDKPPITITVNSAA
jgi:hypothetical protein